MYLSLKKTKKREKQGVFLNVFENFKLGLWKMEFLKISLRSGEVS